MSESAPLYWLLEGDNYLILCLREATLYQMSYTLRHLFATILAYCKVDSPRKLWEQFEIAMSEDYARLNIPAIDKK